MSHSLVHSVLQLAAWASARARARAPGGSDWAPVDAPSTAGAKRSREERERPGWPGWPGWPSGP
eukprot:4808754-Alexandrium_andersonii.AAC.1